MAKNTDAETPVEEANPLEAPGFHVVQGKTYCGTYETKEDAQAFIDGHVTPQELEAKIVEGPAA